MRKIKEFVCQSCGRPHQCPTCGRPYKNAEEVAKLVLYNKKKRKCKNCETNFIAAISTALGSLGKRPSCTQITGKEMKKKQLRKRRIEIC